MSLPNILDDINNLENKHTQDLSNLDNIKANKTLLSNYLPLSGGTLTGRLVPAPNASGGICLPNANDMLILCSAPDYTQGAFLELYGGTYTGWNEDNREGGFLLGAHDPSSYSHLRGYADGRLKWNHQIVDTVVASGSGYIRYKSGMQICYGRITANCASAGGSVTWTFPVAFSEVPTVVCSDTGSLNGQIWIARASTPSKTACNILLRYSAPNGDWGNGVVPSIAIGLWD